MDSMKKDRLGEPAKLTPKIKAKLAKRKEAKAKKTVTQTGRKKAFLNAIMGLGLLAVFVSIAYSTSVVLMGVNTLESKIALFPQVMFEFILLGKSFSKLFR